MWLGILGGKTVLSIMHCHFSIKVSYRRVTSKQQLPNYGVFDEKRYFQQGNERCVVPFKGYHLGLLICEDIWINEPIDALKQAGADLVLSINASPL